MGKRAVNVSRGDERVGDDGLLHRVVSKQIANDRVAISFDVVRPSGGVSLRFEDWDRHDDTDFDTPARHDDRDDYDPA